MNYLYVLSTQSLWTNSWTNHDDNETLEVKHLVFFLITRKLNFCLSVVLEGTSSILKFPPSRWLMTPLTNRTQLFHDYWDHTAGKNAQGLPKYKKACKGCPSAQHPLINHSTLILFAQLSEGVQGLPQRSPTLFFSVSFCLKTHICYEHQSSLL